MMICLNFLLFNQLRRQRSAAYNLLTWSHAAKSEIPYRGWLLRQAGDETRQPRSRWKPSSRKWT